MICNPSSKNAPTSLRPADLQSAASKIANPAGRLTVVQKGGPENKKVDHRKAVVASYRNNCFFFYNTPAILLQYLLYYNKSILLLPTPP